MGLISGLCGRGAIVATTVERVVLDHLRLQIEELGMVKDGMAVKAIQSIVEEEQEHHDASKSHLEDGVVTMVFSLVVKVSTEVVIWLGMKL